MVVKVASVRHMQLLLAPSLPVLRTVDLQKEYDGSEFDRLRQNCRYFPRVVCQVSTSDDSSLSPAHPCEYSEEGVESPCVCVVFFEYSPAPTATHIVQKVQAMSESGLHKSGQSVDVFKAQRAFATKIPGQGFSEEASVRSSVATAVKI